jgi:hypothetical protein
LTRERRERTLDQFDIERGRLLVSAFESRVTSRADADKGGDILLTQASRNPSQLPN